MKEFFAEILRLPFAVYIASLLASVVWCIILGIIDNEAPTTATFIERYLDLMAWLWYGLPVTICILWLTVVIRRRGYRPLSALRWSIPLGCLCGTLLGLVIIGTIYGWIRLTNFA